MKTKQELAALLVDLLDTREQTRVTMPHQESRKAQLESAQRFVEAICSPVGAHVVELEEPEQPTGQVAWPDETPSSYEPTAETEAVKQEPLTPDPIVPATKRSGKKRGKRAK